MKDRGLTLLELAVAVFVLAVGSMAALRAADQARLGIGGAEPRMLAGHVARNRAEEFRLYGVSQAGRLPGLVRMGGREFTIAVTTAPTEGGLMRVDILARPSGVPGPGALIVTYLPVLP